jgi:Tat protein translocase TatC
MIQFAFQKLFNMREKANRARPGADQGFDAHEKPFLDHLEDLRTTLIKIVATLSISTIVCFAFNEQIYSLVQIPAKLKLAEIAPGVSLWDKLDLITLGPPEFIILMLKLAFFSGLILTFPFTVYFLFQFLLPGLRQVEKRAVIPGALIGFILFLVGAAFAFFLATPIALRYFYIFENERISNIDPAQSALEKPIGELSLIGFDGKKILPLSAKPVSEKAPETPAPGEVAATGESALTPELKSEIRNYLKESLATDAGANFALRYDEARDKMILVAAKGGKSVYRIGEYITFIVRLVLVFGISFQMPVVVSILVKLELLTARVMRETRTYAWIIILVAAAILTPPDILTLAMLGGPMILLYEICIIIATIMERSRAKAIRAEEEERKSRLEQLYLKPATELSEEEKAEVHRAEIEQYEKEHEHLYQEDSDHVARDGFHGDDPYHPDPTQHDESWHADDHYWHDSHEGDPHAGMESDHAEAEDLTPEESENQEDSGEGEPEVAKEETAPAPSENEYETCAPSGPIVDLNHATEAELTTLPGIGPKMAAVIIENRPYETFDDVEKVPGLGPEKIQRIIDRVMLG